jgi:hypothetical protein
MREFDSRRLEAAIENAKNAGLGKEFFYTVTVYQKMAVSTIVNLDIIFIMYSPVSNIFA